jgi:hypothetical protein
MWQQSHTSTDNAIQHTLITIGGVNYDIDVSQIPYLSSFANFNGKAQPQGTELVHGPIPLMDAALNGIQSGYRQCFRALPPDLSQHHILCETYDFLGIDVLGEQYVDEIFADLKACKTDYELEYKCYLAVKGNKSKARDAAFKLLYLILVGEFRDEGVQRSLVHRLSLCNVQMEDEDRDSGCIPGAFCCHFEADSKAR